MRVGAMVVGILFAIWTFFEAMLVGALGSVGESDEIQAMAGGGLIAAILVGVAAALVLAVPQVSMILFALGGIVSYISAAGGYGNHWLYGTIFLGLAIMAFFGWRGKKREKVEKAEQNARFEYLLSGQGAAAGGVAGGVAGATAGLDQATRMLVANNLSPDEEVLVTVRGKRETIIVSTSAITILPASQKRKESLPVQQYRFENVSSARMDTTKKGAVLVIVDHGMPYTAELVDQNQIDQAIRAVTIIRGKISEFAPAQIEPASSSTPSIEGSLSTQGAL